jgi:hypothetical protein
MSVEILNDDAIAELLSKTKTRGDYDREIMAFVSGGEKGVEVSLNTGTFAGKKATSVKTGFELARKREATLKEQPDAANVRVINADNRIYLIRTDLVS